MTINMTETDNYITDNYTIEDGVFTRFLGEGDTCTIPEGVTRVGSAAFMNNPRIRKVYIPDSVTVIEDNAFYSCVGLEEVRMSGNVESIENNAFANCYSLREIRIPETLRKIGESGFYYCKSLREVELPAGIEKIEDRTFSGCESLRAVIVPEGVRSIGRKAFNYCSSLREVVIPGSVQVIGSEAFMRCTRLSRLVIGDGVERIETLAFAHCEHLKTTKLPNSLYKLGDHAFQDTGLSEIEVPGGVEVLEDCVFADCGWLTTVKLHEGLRKIVTHAFWKCYNLDNIRLPMTVEYLGPKAFRECLKLRTLWIMGVMKQMNNAIELSYEYNAGTIYAPRTPIDRIPSEYQASAMNGFEDSFRIGLDMSQVKDSYVKYIRRYKNIYYPRGLREIEWLRLMLNEGVIQDDELPGLIEKASRGGYVEASATLLEYQSRHEAPKIDYDMFELP